MFDCGLGHGAIKPNLPFPIKEYWRNKSCRSGWGNIVRREASPSEFFVCFHPEAIQGFVRDVRAVVVGMTCNCFTIAEPNDRGMLDVVGFDTNAPAVIADFLWS